MTQVQLAHPSTLVRCLLALASLSQDLELIELREQHVQLVVGSSGPCN